MVKRALLAGLALLCVSTSCEPELSLGSVLRGRGCRLSQPQCVPGYACNEENVCVPLSTLPSARGSGGSSGAEGSNPSNAGSEPGLGGSAAIAEQPAAGGSAGSGAPGSAGAASLPELDAGTPPPPDTTDAAPPPDGGCTPVTLYRDRDNDGFGSERAGDQDFGCPTPGWVTVGLDCFDAEPTDIDRADRVHPAQTGYFPTGYHPDPNQFSVASFDYDCSGTEEFDPTNSFGEVLPDCSSLELPCIGNGYLPTERTGPGIHEACGQEQFVLCLPESDLTCIAGETQLIQNNDQLARCH
jgi:hypothetical protein